MAKQDRQDGNKKGQASDSVSKTDRKRRKAEEKAARKAAKKAAKSPILSVSVKSISGMEAPQATFDPGERALTLALPEGLPGSPGPAGRRYNRFSPKDDGCESWFCRIWIAGMLSGGPRQLAQPSE